MSSTDSPGLIIRSYSVYRLLRSGWLRQLQLRLLQLHSKLPQWLGNVKAFGRISITQIPCPNSKVYIASASDCWNNEFIDLAMDNTQKSCSGNSRLSIRSGNDVKTLQYNLKHVTNKMKNASCFFPSDVLWFKAMNKMRRGKPVEQNLSFREHPVGGRMQTDCLNTFLSSCLNRAE